MIRLPLINSQERIPIPDPVSPTTYPPLPTSLLPHPIVSNIAFAEGPIFDDRGDLYFVNYMELGTLGRFSSDGTVEVWTHTGGQVNGLKYDGHGHLVAADLMGDRITRFDLRTKAMEVLTDGYEGTSYVGPNDIALDLKGNIYFSDSGRDENLANGGVYRINVDRENCPTGVDQLGHNMPFPNGLAVHPDQKRLFVGTSGTNTIHSYDIAADGALANDHVVHEFPNATVDGMQFDEHGRLWVARWMNGSVDVLDPDSGDLLASYAMGGSGVTNVAWWGNSLYATVSGRNSIERLDVGVGPADIVPKWD
jgi:gluconolactonase